MSGVGKMSGPASPGGAAPMSDLQALARLMQDPEALADLEAKTAEYKAAKAAADEATKALADQEVRSTNAASEATRLQREHRAQVEADNEALATRERRVGEREQDAITRERANSSLTTTLENRRVNLVRAAERVVTEFAS